MRGDAPLRAKPLVGAGSSCPETQQRDGGGQGCFLSSCSEPQLQGQLQCLVPLDGRTELHPGGGRCVSFWFTDEKTEAQSTDLLPHLQGCWG